MPQRRRVQLDKRGRPVVPSAPEREVQPPECACPRLEPSDWYEVESDWSDIAFLRASLPALFGVPLRYRAVRQGLFEHAQAAGLRVPSDAMVLLGEGRFLRRLLLEVEGEATNLWRPGGFAFSRLVPAPYGALRRAAERTVAVAKERYGRAPDFLWVWYLTCSLCSSAREFETLFIAHYVADGAAARS